MLTAWIIVYLYKNVILDVTNVVCRSNYLRSEILLIFFEKYNFLFVCTFDAHLHLILPTLVKYKKNRINKIKFWKTKLIKLWNSSP